MAIPDYETLILPTLQFAADKNEHSSHETIEYLANRYPRFRKTGQGDDGLPQQRYICQSAPGHSIIKVGK
jgi:hypothetical protein